MSGPLVMNRAQRRAFQKKNGYDALEIGAMKGTTYINEIKREKKRLRKEGFKVT